MKWIKTFVLEKAGTPKKHKTMSWTEGKKLELESAEHRKTFMGVKKTHNSKKLDIWKNPEGEKKLVCKRVGQKKNLVEKKKKLVFERVGQKKKLVKVKKKNWYSKRLDIKKNLVELNKKIEFERAAQPSQDI